LFLAIGLSLGITGLVALIWLIVSFYQFVVRVKRVSLNPEKLSLFRAAWLGVTVTLVHGLTDAPQFSVPGWTMPMFFAMLGLTILIGRPALQVKLEQDNNVALADRRLGWQVLAMIAFVLIVTVAVFWRPLVSAWYANIGAVYQTRAELSPDLSDATREAMAERAIIYFERSLSLNPSQPVANRRFGMMALDRQVFDVATVYLSRAYEHEPGNQATLKALGYAYLWTGQLDAAEELLWQRDDRNQLVTELGTWSWWWSTQDRMDLSEYANEMRQRLSRER
jgi:tetratricopeptide (TPR) repeat protein